jgi:hypothetical protein
VSISAHSRLPLFRVADRSAERWLWNHAPCSWIGNVEIDLKPVSFWSLEPACSLKHWDVVALWTRQMACRRQIPPFIVSLTDHDTYFIHDGNHRYEALRICYRNHLLGLQVPVAIVKPKPPYRFALRQFSSYSTYQLSRKTDNPQPAPSSSSSMYNPVCLLDVTSPSK